MFFTEHLVRSVNHQSCTVNVKN